MLVKYAKRTRDREANTEKSFPTDIVGKNTIPILYYVYQNIYESNKQFLGCHMLVKSDSRYSLSPVY